MIPKLFKPSILLVIFVAIHLQLLAQQQMDLTIYDMSNTTAFTTSSFKAVGVGKFGYLWAGTANQGLYKHNGNGWVKIPTTLLNNNINDIKSDEDGGIWIAQSGNTGAQALTGGIHYFPDTSNTFSYYGATTGAPSRNARGIHVNNYLHNPAHPKMRVWSAHIGQITGGVSGTGAIGRGNSSTSNPQFYSITTGIQTAMGLGTVPAIAGSLSRVWAFAQNNYGRNTILVYNLATQALVDSFNNLNSILPSNFVARAIYYDLGSDRWWVGTSTGDIYTYTNGTWTLLNISYTTGPVNANAITGDHDGNIYIGTTTGLIVYRGGAVTESSSYRKYSILNGLPSSNVQAVCLDYTTYPVRVVLGTQAGIAIWNPVNDIQVFNIKNGNTSGKRYKLEYNPTESIRIAADSSISTLFKITGSNLSNYKFRITQDPAGSLMKLYGQIIPVAHNADSLVIMMRHPSFADIPAGAGGLNRVMDLEVYDSVNQTVIKSYEIEIYRPPLLLVHGLWSNGFDCWGSTRQALQAQNLYRGYQVRTANYFSDQHFSFNAASLLLEKHTLLKETIEYEKISCGKIDAAAHSMGGVLLRLYLQSTKYRNDINKLMTFNTPHAGSNVANYLAANVTGFPESVRTILKATNYNPYGGAIADLKANSAAITTTLNGPGNLNNNTVPTHVVATTHWLANVPTLPFAIPDDFPTKFPYDKLVIALIKLHNGVSFINNDLFNGHDHDLIVEDESQMAGLSAPYLSVVSNQQHSGSVKNTQVHSILVSLLNADPSDALTFTTNGFYPNGFVPLTVPAGYKPAGKHKTTAGTLNITSPANNSVHSTNANVTFSFNYTQVDTMMFMIGSETNPLYTCRVVAPSTSITFPIPEEYIGKVKVKMAGFDATGFSAEDSLEIDITTAATLDTILPVQKFYQIPQGHNSICLLNGLYTDTVIRNLTGLTGITYNFSQNNASFTGPNLINGDMLGYDTLTVNYLGKTATIYIEVIDSTNWVNIPVGAGSTPLPIDLGPLSGSVKDTTAVLNWTAYTEKWTGSYEVERSINGIDFRSLDEVAVENRGTATNYTYVDYSPEQGVNFYRLKVTDIEGEVLYSNTVQLSFGRQALSDQGIVYPNPVTRDIQIKVSALKGQVCSVNIVDMKGATVLTKEVQLQQGVNSLTFDIDQLVPGTYVIRLEVDQKSVQDRFIKQ